MSSDDREPHRRDWMPPPSEEYQRQHPDWDKPETDKSAEPDWSSFLARISIQGWADLQIEPEEEFLGPIITSTSRVLLAGSTGLGKTLLAHAAAAGMTSGKGFLHWRCCRPARVLIIDGEMPAELLKDRASDLVAANPMMPPGMFVYAVAHADQYVRDFGLPDWAPLNTDAGQILAWKLIEIVAPDVVIYDNVMSLIAGSQKEEEAWAQSVGLFTEVSNRRIGQLFLDHTGIDKTRTYGTNTKLWRIDAVGIMSPIPDQPPGVTAFNLSFELPHGKARRRKPSNWHQFEPQIIRLEDGRWTSEPVTPPSARIVTKPSAKRTDTTHDQVASAVASEMLRRQFDVIHASEIVKHIASLLVLQNTAARDRLNDAIPEAPDGRDLTVGDQHVRLWRAKENPLHPRSPLLIKLKVL